VKTAFDVQNELIKTLKEFSLPEEEAKKHKIKIARVQPKRQQLIIEED
jgi:hypothetical protein